MSASYFHRRRKFFRDLADHFHDKVLECVFPETAAKWALLMDAALWAADPEGDTDEIKAMASASVSLAVGKGESE